MQIIDGKAYENWPAHYVYESKAVAEMWDNLFGPLGCGKFPKRLVFHCGAQFVVTRDRIQQAHAGILYAGACLAFGKPVDPHVIVHCLSAA